MSQPEARIIDVVYDNLLKDQRIQKVRSIEEEAALIRERKSGLSANMRKKILYLYEKYGNQK